MTYLFIVNHQLYCNSNATALFTILVITIIPYNLFNHWDRLYPISKSAFMKYILLFILFICSSNIIKAQDTLSTRYGENILVKVIEVGTAEVKYKKLDNLNGPVFSMLKSDLLMIKYANGTNEDFNKEEKSKIKVKRTHNRLIWGIVGGAVFVGLLIGFGQFLAVVTGGAR